MSAIAEDATAAVDPRKRRRRLLRKRFLRRPAAVAGLVVVVTFVVMAAFAPQLAPYSPSATDFNALLAHPSSSHLLGTDSLGRDVLSRIIYGRACVDAGRLLLDGARNGDRRADRDGRRLLPRLARHRRRSGDGRAARVSVHHPRGRARRHSRAVAAQRDARARHRGGAGVHPDLARRDAFASGGGLRARRDRERRRRRHHHLPPHPSEHVEHAARPGDRHHPGCDRRRGGALVPRARSPAADVVVGRDAAGRAVVSRRRRRASPCIPGSPSCSRRSRSTCSATACATSSIRERRADGGSAAGGDGPLGPLRHGRRSGARGRPALVHAGRGRGARDRRGIRLRQERDLHVDRAPAAGDGGGERQRNVRRRRPAGAVAARAAAGSRARDRLRLPGADDVAQPGLHRRPPDRRDADAPPRAVAVRGAGARDRAARHRAHPVPRAAARRVSRTSSPAGCASA